MEVTEKYLKSINPTLTNEPVNFSDYCVKVQQIHVLAEKLVELGCIEKITSFHQNSNHYADIYTGYGSLRFSKFENLVAITHEEKFPDNLLELVINAVRDDGYVYVPWEFFGESFSTRERINGDLFNQLFDYV